ncbi:MAG TPA: TIGR03435 family protein [Bryobacteraceae bacterium]|jgi:uncharacterized protein (TIGR03435 family)
MTKPQFTLGLLSAFAALSSAQEAPRFDVTSVKLNKLDPRQRQLSFGCSNGDFVSRGQGLRSTLLWAFEVKPYQFSGLPAWVDSSDAIYDIEGKSASPVTEDQCKLMVQALLADRFTLATHREAKEIPIYALVVAKGGPKFKLASGDQQTKVTVNGSPVRVAGPPAAAKDAKAPSGGWSMQQLANFASNPLFLGPPGRPVFERTRLEGSYQFSLDFSVAPPGRAPGGDAPDLFAALEQQLGLKLEDRKESAQMLVFDHFERPDAN